MIQRRRLGEEHVKTSRILLLTAACMAAALAQEKKDQKAPEEKQAKSEASKPAKEEEKGKPGKSESIAVHGHWVLQINNPDGTLASRHEFENSLLSTGATPLSTVLAGAGTAGAWGVLITAAGPGAALIYQTANQCSTLPTLYAGTCSASLTVSTTQGQIVLQGTTAAFPASLAGTVLQVQTTLYTCNPSTSIANCISTSPGQGAFFVTMAAPSGNISVLTGQTITATVTISFH